MISNTAADSSVIDAVDDFLRPAQAESVCDWVEKHVELPTGAITGRIQLDMMPYARDILEDYSNRHLRHLVLVFPTQSGKTTILTAGMLYRIARDPEDAMWVMGNADQARDFNKERFMPFVHLCGPVLDLVPRTTGGAIDKNLWGFTSQHYRTMVLNFVGAGSTTNLSSRPRGFLQMDEVDKYYDEIKFDAGTIQLAEERQKTFAFPLSVKASSPTLETRMIWTEYLKTDQRQYWVPCPRCEKPIILRFRIKSPVHGDCGVRWWHENEEEARTDGEWDMAKVRANSYYRCQECAGMIHDFERADMLRAGKWIPDRPRADISRRGYHINSIYSILGNETSLAGIAIKFLIARGNRSELQNFCNGWLAETWDEYRQMEDREMTLEVYNPDNIPKDDSVSLMSIDVQQKGFWVLVRKFALPTKEKPFGESWLLYADFVDVEEDLVAIQKDYEVKGENVVVDMAHRPNQVARMIIAHDWRGIWGSDTKKFDHPCEDGTKTQRPYSRVQFRDPNLGTAWENRTLARARYILFNKAHANDAVSALRYNKPSIWHTTINANPRYPRQLNSRVKRLQRNKRTGRVEWIWCELHQENHFADCENHVTIMAQMRGLVILPPESDLSHAV